MSISDEIKRLREAKESIRQAVSSKGVAIPDTAKISDYPQYISNISADGSMQGYDLIIRTQEEFDTFVTSLNNKTCTARSLLLVGDGGTLEFTSTSDLALPSTLITIDGINNAIISIATVTNRQRYVIYYSDAVSSGIDKVPKGARVSGIALKTSCNGFTLLRDVINCRCIFNAKSYACAAFAGCFNLINCDVELIGSSDVDVAGYRACYNLVNCSYKDDVEFNKYKGFDRCHSLVNCNGESKNMYDTRGVFDNCTQLTNCEGKNLDSGTAYVACSEISNCRGSASGGYIFYDCSYINGCRRSENGTGPMFMGTTTYIDADTCEEGEYV